MPGVRRIKGFKRYQGGKCRTGTGYLEDIKNEYCHLFGEVGIEDRKQHFRFVRRGCSSIERHKIHKKNKAIQSLMKLLELHNCLAFTE